MCLNLYNLEFKGVGGPFITFAHGPIFGMNYYCGYHNCIPVHRQQKTVGQSR